jgi:drug/metabolite transporter (DMT)-like permease
VVSGKKFKNSKRGFKEVCAVGSHRKHFLPDSFHKRDFPYNGWKFFPDFGYNPYICVSFQLSFGTEKVERRVWQSIIISFLGVSLIVLGSGKPLTLTGQSLTGDLLILVGTICWSVYTVLSKPLLGRYTPLKLTSLTIALGTPLLVLVSIPSIEAQDWNAIPTQGWLSLAFSACLAIALGYALWYTGVSRIGSARTSLYEYMVTVIAVATAWIFLYESMTLIQIAGAALVFIGLYFSRKSHMKDGREHAKKT